MHTYRIHFKPGREIPELNEIKADGFINRASSKEYVFYEMNESDASRRTREITTVVEKDSVASIQRIS